MSHDVPWERVDGQPLSVFDAADELSGQGSGKLALLYARVFGAPFMEYQGLVLLSGTLELDDGATARLEGELTDGRWDRSEIEQRFNFYELGMLIGDVNGLDECDYMSLAHMVARIWRARLHAEFSGKRFVVDVVVAGEKDGHELGIVFYQYAGGGHS